MINYIKIITGGNFPYGGASANYLRNFSLALQIQGNDVEVLMTTGEYYGKNIDINTRRTGNIENVKFRHLCYIIHPRNIIGKILDNICGAFSPILYLFNQNIKNKHDIIIIYNTTYTSTLLFVIIKKILRKRIIIILPEFYEKPKKSFLS